MDFSTADKASNLVNCLRQADEEPKNLEMELADFARVPSKYVLYSRE